FLFFDASHPLRSSTLFPTRRSSDLWPLKTEWYWPASVSLTSRFVRISIWRIFLRMSRGIIRMRNAERGTRNRGERGRLGCRSARPRAEHLAGGQANRFARARRAAKDKGDVGCARRGRAPQRPEHRASRYEAGSAAIRR